MYDVNGKRVCVYRYPDLSMTPEALGIFIVFLIGFLILDFFHLSYGGIASEEQLRKGMMVSSELRTGPDRDYYGEAIELVKKEIHKRDYRVQPADIIFIERHPEDTPYLFGLSSTQKAGYIGDSSFRVCFSYMVSGGKTAEMLYGTGVAMLEQKPVAFLVKQVWHIKSFGITRQEANRNRFAQ